MSDPAPTPYDTYPYPSYAYPVTHPDNLAVIARLFGLSPAPIERCRVLELGCASGGNLIPMAAGLPESHFVGVDHSARQIADGRQLVETLGLPNIELRTADILALGPDLGTFDYFICHGVYSWVPRLVREQILELARLCLAPHGVAVISHNVYPGWHQGEMLRAAMRYHTDVSQPPAQRVARARELLAFLLALAEGDAHDTRAAFLREEQERLSGLDDAYVFYEYLEGDNHPSYFHEFIARAEAHGLGYLGNGRRETMFADNQPDRIVEALRTCRDAVEAQQYLDIFNNWRFRSTLLCRTEAPVELDIAGPAPVLPLYLRADVSPDPGLGDIAADVPVAVKTRRGHAAEVCGPMIRLALSMLSREAPRALAFEAVAGEVVERLRAESLDARAGTPDGPAAIARDLAAHVLRLYFAGIIELHTRPVTVSPVLGPRPTATKLARAQVSRGQYVATQWHETRLIDPFTRAVLALLDGSRSQPELVSTIQAEVAGAALVLPAAPNLPTDVPGLVAHVLEWLRHEALLVG